MLLRCWLFLGIAFTPLYLFESGGIQIAHALFILFFLGSFAVWRPRNASTPFVSRARWAFSIFVVYAAIRESVAFANSGQALTLLNPVHALFGLATFFFVSGYFEQKELSPIKQSQLVAYSVVVSVLIATIGVVIFGFSISASEFVERPVGTFNNPNQIGYFSVISCGLATTLFFSNNLGTIKYVAIIFATFFLAIVSLSKAAMIAILLPPAALFASLALKDGANNRLIFFALFVALSLGMASIMIIEPIDLSNLIAVERLVNFAAENDSDLGVRGYHLYLEATAFEQIFGISSFESALRRDGAEVHSTFMAPITYYGPIGGIAFLAVFYFWVTGCRHRYGWLGAFSICMPVVLYGITHNGGRFTLLWILVAVSLTIRPKNLSENLVRRRILRPTVMDATSIRQPSLPGA